MRTHVKDQLAMASHLEECPELRPTEYFLKISCPDTEQDDQRLSLLDFMAESESTHTITVVQPEEDPITDEFRQQPHGWVHHQIWLKDRAKCRTVSKQPKTVLAPTQLEEALKQLVCTCEENVCPSAH